MTIGGLEISNHNLIDMDAFQSYLFDHWMALVLVKRNNFQKFTLTWNLILLQLLLISLTLYKFDQASNKSTLISFKRVKISLILCDLSDVIIEKDHNSIFH